jgi:hypothetical protein
VALDPIEIIVTRAGEADHLPTDHVAVAAVERIGEETLLHILEQVLREKRLAVDWIELHVAALDALQHLVLIGV